MRRLPLLARQQAPLVWSLPTGGTQLPPITHAEAVSFSCADGDVLESWIYLSHNFAQGNGRFVSAHTGLPKQFRDGLRAVRTGRVLFPLSSFLKSFSLFEFLNLPERQSGIFTRALQEDKT